MQDCASDYNEVLNLTNAISNFPVFCLICSYYDSTNLLKESLKSGQIRERLEMHTQASEKPRKKILLRKGEADVGFALGFGESSLGVHCAFVLLLHLSARNFCSTSWDWFIVL